MSSPAPLDPITKISDELHDERSPRVKSFDDEIGAEGEQTQLFLHDALQHATPEQQGPICAKEQNDAIVSGAEHESIRNNTHCYEESVSKAADMESSTATLKPTMKESLSTLTSQPQQDATYMDPTPKTPSTSQPPSRSASTAASFSRPAHTREPPDQSPSRSDAGFDENNMQSEEESEPHPKSEIQSIMQQFSEEGEGPCQEEIMSPRLEFAGPLLGSSSQHPPRKSSLDPFRAKSNISVEELKTLQISPSSPLEQRNGSQFEDGPAVPPKQDSIRSLGRAGFSDDPHTQIESSMSPHLHRPPPPEPEPEPDLPFDFHRFLEQLRHKTADPVAKFLRSFLQEFGKKQWMVHEQVKIIGDFLSFITNKMAQCEVWRNVSDAEFDNAREGMEKLVMNRLYTQTFSPAIPPPQPIPAPRSGRKGLERLLGPGRKGQHQEDVERDQILAQKVSIYGWVRESHLDIPPVGESGKRFLGLAQQELLKIKTYRAPRDKIICVLNCCKVIFGLLKHSKADSSADSFMPLLIYVVLQANPEHLVSNVQYILRFRNQEKLAGEAGYYLSSLMGAVQFIESLDRTSLTISDEDFEKNVEAAVSAIAEKHKAEEAAGAPTATQPEKLATGRLENTPGCSIQGEPSTPQRSASSNENENIDNMDEKAAISGLLRTIQRPLTSIGRIFTEEGNAGPVRTPLPGSTPRMSPNPHTNTTRQTSPPITTSARTRINAEDAAARQASAESAEAHRIQQAEHANVVETLSGMFPDLDKEIISDVVTQKGGRVGLAVDACLALSS